MDNNKKWNNKKNNKKWKKIKKTIMSFKITALKESTYK